MSYRNPQIVIDNSGSEYGKMIANFGANVAKGIDSFSEQRKKAREVARKREESNQLALNQSELRENQRINKFLKTVPDKSMNDAVKDQIRSMATTGEGNTVNVNGKDYTIGSVKAQALLNSDPNLDKDTREAYLQVVNKYNGYMDDMGSVAASITINNEQIGLDKEGFISKEYDILGEGGKGTSNLIASMAINNNLIEGVESKKEYNRSYNSATKEYDNILTIKSRIKKDSTIGKSWANNDLYENEDGSVSFEEELNEKGEPTGYLTTTFERNLNEVGENGLGLIVKIQPQGVEDTLSNAGFTDPKTADATGEGFVSSKINGSRTLENGIRVTTSETHFNQKALFDNRTYIADNKKIAAGILALPLDQQVKYMANNLGWGNLEGRSWADMDTDLRTKMITNSLKEDDLNKMLSIDPQKNPLQSRKATASDVASYAASKQVIKEGDPIYFTEKLSRASADKDKLGKNEVSAKEYFKILQDPEEALQLLGNPGESSFNSKTNVISLKQETGQTKTTTEGDIETKEPIYEDITYDLNTKKGGQDYVNAMVGKLEGLQGSANQDKVLAIKRMVGEFFDKTQSKEAQEFNKKKKPGILDNINIKKEE